MDFYVDLAVAVLLRLTKDRRNAHKYFDALAKVYLVLESLAAMDPAFANQVKSKRSEKQ